MCVVSAAAERGEYQPFGVANRDDPTLLLNLRGESHRDPKTVCKLVLKADYRPKLTHLPDGGALLYHRSHLTTIVKS